MLGKGNFVFSIHYGIGVITDVLNNKYTVKYENNVIKAENAGDFDNISNDVIEQISSGRYKDYFSITTLEKGEEYYFSGKISDLMILDRNIYAKAKGVNEYSLSIILTPNSIRTKCSCPVGTMCKHSAGALFSVDNIISKLLVNNIKPTKTVTNNNYDRLLSFAITINPELTQLKDLERIKELHRLLINAIDSNEALISFINAMDKYRTETNIYRKTKDLIISIIGLSNILKVYTYKVSGILNKISIANLLNSSKTDVDRLNTYNQIDAYKGVIYSIINDDYSRYLYFINKSKYSGSYFDQYFINNYNESVLKDITEDENNLKLISDSILKFIFKNSSIPARKHLVQALGREFLEINDIDCDIKDTLYFLPYVKDKGYL